VRTAVSQGKVSRQRYDSYLRLFEEHEVLDDKLY
jgi:putative ribosome biogenesis GTPase RsgA